MEYKKAAEIRNKGLLSLIAENKFREGKGLGASIGGAISQKFKAKATGIKESFDPLNIVRKMTGKGTFGRIATTIAGRAMGKSEKDISYFGGYTKKVKHQYVDTNVSPLEHDGEYRGSTHEPIAGILGEMYQFMQQTHEVDKKDYEIQQAFLEEQNSDAETRHKQLVRAIKKYVKVPVKEAEKTEGGGMFDWIMGKLGEWGTKFEEFTKMIKSLIAPVLAFLNGALFSALSAAKWLIGALGSPMLFAAALGLATLWKLYNDENPEETNKGLQNALGGSEVPGRVIMETVENTTNIERRKQNILAERPLSKKSFNIFDPSKDVELQQNYLQEIGWDNNTGLTQKERDAGFTGINEKGVPVKTQPVKSVDNSKPKVDQVKDSSVDTNNIKPIQNSKTEIPADNQTTKTSNVSAIPADNQTLKTSNVTPALDIPNSASVTPMPMNTSIPTQSNLNESVSSSNQPVVVATNTTNNIGGGPAQSYNMNPISVRNTDLYKFLRNTAVPV
jgi:hypothetical protein